MQASSSLQPQKLKKRYTVWCCDVFWGEPFGVEQDHPSELLLWVRRSSAKTDTAIYIYICIYVNTYTLTVKQHNPTTEEKSTQIRVPIHLEIFISNINSLQYQLHVCWNPWEMFEPKQPQPFCTNTYMWWCKGCVVWFICTVSLHVAWSR